MSAAMDSPAPTARRPLRPAAAGGTTPARGLTPPLLQAPGRDTSQHESIDVARGFMTALAVLVMACGVGLALVAGNLDGAHLVAPILVAAGGAIVIRIAYLRRAAAEGPTGQVSGPVVVSITADTTRFREQMSVARAVVWRTANPSLLRDVSAPAMPRAVDEWSVELLAGTHLDETRPLLLAKACDADQHTRDRGRGFDGLRAHLRVDGTGVAS